MKKLLNALLGLVCIFALALATAERADGSCSVVWTVSCILVAVACGVIWGEFLSPAPLHIEDEVYDDLNRQIRAYTETMEDGYRETEFESGGVKIKVGISCTTRKTKFTDDAWGQVRTFTETTWSCKVEIVGVEVCDENGRRVESHDFDEEYIETEYEGGGNWG